MSVRTHEADTAVTGSGIGPVCRELAYTKGHDKLMPIKFAQAGKVKIEPMSFGLTDEVRRAERPVLCERPRQACDGNG